MIIDKKLLDKWKALRSPEDAGKMSEKLPGSYPESFARAIRLGKCNDTMFKIIADFYEEKAQLIKQYL